MAYNGQKCVKFLDLPLLATVRCHEMPLKVSLNSRPYTHILSSEKPSVMSSDI